MSLLPQPQPTWFDNNGAVLSFGLIYTYEPNTTTPKSTYQDDAETTANANPVVLGSDGRALLYGTGNFRFVVKTALGVTVYDSETASTLPSTAISDVMAPVVSAPTLAVARTRMGIDDELAAYAATISLITGPTGPASTTPGPTGPTGPAGTGTTAANRQVFTSSGTWVKPGAGSLAIIQMWGSGGGASDTGAGTGGAGGGGGYTCVCVLLSDLAASVAVTVGAGGIFTSLGLVGGDGGQTNFGGYLQQVGGRGGNVGYNGAQGYLVSASGVNIVFGSTQQFTTYNNQFDAYGNMANTSPFSGTTGASGDAPTAWPSIFGGTGGPYFSPGTGGSSPGGGGGTNGGNGGNGQVIVTVI